MDKFKTFIQDAKVDGLQYSSMHYTWMNQSPENLIMQKLDRVLVNEKWSLNFPLPEARFLPLLVYGTILPWWLKLAMIKTSRNHLNSLICG
jgi:hypothetical protein